MSVEKKVAGNGVEGPQDPLGLDTPNIGEKAVKSLGRLIRTKVVPYFLVSGMALGGVGCKKEDPSPEIPPPEEECLNVDPVLTAIEQGLIGETDTAGTNVLKICYIDGTPPENLTITGEDAPAFEYINGMLQLAFNLDGKTYADRDSNPKNPLSVTATDEYGSTIEYTKHVKDAPNTTEIDSTKPYTSPWIRNDTIGNIIQSGVRPDGYAGNPLINIESLDTLINYTLLRPVTPPNTPKRQTIAEIRADIPRGVNQGLPAGIGNDGSLTQVIHYLNADSVGVLESLGINYSNSLFTKISNGTVLFTIKEIQDLMKKSGQFAVSLGYSGGTLSLNNYDGRLSHEQKLYLVLTWILAQKHQNPNADTAIIYVRAMHSANWSDLSN